MKSYMDHFKAQPSMLFNKAGLLLLTALLLLPQTVMAKRLHCQKFVGTYEKWKITIYFNKDGVMIVQADKPGQGWTARLGQYQYKGKKISAIIHSYRRTFTIEPNQTIQGSPYDFDVAKDYKSQIHLTRDPSYICPK